MRSRLALAIAFDLCGRSKKRPSSNVSAYSVIGSYFAAICKLSDTKRSNRLAISADLSALAMILVLRLKLEKRAFDQGGLSSEIRLGNIISSSSFFSWVS